MALNRTETRALNIHGWRSWKPSLAVPVALGGSGYDQYLKNTTDASKNPTGLEGCGPKTVAL